MLDFSWNAIDLVKSLKKATEGGLLRFSKEQKIGFGKNDKYDYKQRLQKLLKNSQISEEAKSKEEKNKANNEANEENQKQNKEKENEDEYNDFEKEDNNQNKEQNEEDYGGFEESKEKSKQSKMGKEDPDKEEKRNEKAKVIQKRFRDQKNHKRLRDRIYFGFDQSQKYIVFLYIDKKTELDESGNYDICSLFYKVYNVEEKKMIYEKKEVGDLLFDKAISKADIQKAIPDIVEKVIEGIKNEENDEEIKYNFEEVHSEKGAIHNEDEISISSIAKEDD